MPMVTYKLTPPISTKFFNFNKFVNNLDLDLFLTNPDSLPCKCNNSPFVDRYHKHIVTGDLRIIKNNAFRKLFIKGPNYREVRPINLEKSKRCILEGLHNCISSWCYKNGVDKSFVLEWTNNVKVKIDERTSHLTNKLYTSIYRYASVITRKLGLNNNSSKHTYNNAGGLSANDIIREL